VVHGLTGEQLGSKSVNALKGIALRHWNNDGGVLSIGQSPKLESIYKNPELYPQIFPWLFLYGLGGIGSTALGDAAHKQHLLMYHDKRFQTYVNFPFVAFSHEQVKCVSTSSYLMAEQDKFHDITQRLLTVDQDILAELARKMSEGQVVKADSEEEKKCFHVIHDLDQMSGKVKGSITSKKYMRNELWSLMAKMGAPLWYITLSPADNRHPLCLHFADTQEKFEPHIMTSDDQFHLIASNPVAGAQFFHFMVESFIKHVLGVNSDHSGIFGDTSAYYGTVEQQGQLTLHLHLLLWIRGCLSPDEIKHSFMDPESDFQCRLVEYLESAHLGEFLGGTQAEVYERVSKAETDVDYADPTETFPTPPPPVCASKCEHCDCCKNLKAWTSKYLFETDDIIFKTNVH
jgi:hypothetical protein